MSFTEFDVTKDREKAREMIKKSGQIGVPVIIVDEELIVGFNQPKLDQLLAK